MNRRTIESTPDPKLGGFIARVPCIPACGDGETKDEAIADRKEALTAHAEAFGSDVPPTRLKSTLVKPNSNSLTTTPETTSP